MIRAGRPAPPHQDATGKPGSASPDQGFTVNDRSFSSPTQFRSAHPLWLYAVVLGALARGAVLNVALFTPTQADPTPISESMLDHTDEITEADRAAPSTDRPFERIDTTSDTRLSTENPLEEPAG